MFALVLVAIASAEEGQKGAAASDARPALRIGFLAGAPANEPFVRSFARGLLNDSSVAQGAEAPFSTVDLRPAGSFRDLVGNMEGGRYDLVFGPATMLALEQRGNWQVILQERRADDVWDPRPGGAGVLRQSVVIALLHQAAVLDSGNEPGDSRLSIALLFPDSPEGYLVPRMFLAAKGWPDDRLDIHPMEGDRDVWLAVAAGLVQAGAVGRQSEEVFRTRHDALRRANPAVGIDAPVVIAICPPMPSPPVCVATELARGIGAEGVRALSAALEQAAASVPPGDVQLVPATDREYERFVEDARAWYSRRGLFATLR